LLDLINIEKYFVQVIPENEMLRKVFGPEREDVTEDLRILQNGELHNLYTSPNTRVIKSMSFETCGAHRILIGKPERRRPRGKPRHRWNDNIKADFKP